MNKLIPILGGILLTLVACDKDKTPTPSGGGGTGPGPNVTGPITISSWSPQRPYTDEVITFFGGPFPTAPDVLEVQGAIWTPFQILSVATDELQVRPPADFQYSLLYGDYTPVRFIVGEDTTLLYPFYMHRKFAVTQFEQNLTGHVPGLPARAGDSLRFAGRSFTTTGMQVYVDGQPVNAPVAVDSGLFCSMRFRVPAHMGSGEDESELSVVPFVFVNGHGRRDTMLLNYGRTPIMQLHGMELVGGGSTFSISQMNSSGQVLNFRVYGRHLRASQIWNLTGPSPASGTLEVEGYPNEAFLVVNPVSMQPGGYTITVVGCWGCATVNFTLTE